MHARVHTDTRTHKEQSSCHKGRFEREFCYLYHPSSTQPILFCHEEWHLATDKVISQESKCMISGSYQLFSHMSTHTPTLLLLFHHKERVYEEQINE